MGGEKETCQCGLKNDGSLAQDLVKQFAINKVLTFKPFIVQTKNLYIYQNCDKAKFTPYSVGMC